MRLRYVDISCAFRGFDASHNAVSKYIQCEATVEGNFLPHTGCMAGFATLVIDGIHFPNVCLKSFIPEDPQDGE